MTAEAQRPAPNIERVRALAENLRDQTLHARERAYEEIDRGIQRFADPSPDSSFIQTWKMPIYFTLKLGDFTSAFNSAFGPNTTAEIDEEDNPERMFVVLTRPTGINKASGYNIGGKDAQNMKANLGLNEVEEEFRISVGRKTRKKNCWS